MTSYSDKPFHRTSINKCVAEDEIEWTVSDFQGMLELFGNSVLELPHQDFEGIEGLSWWPKIFASRGEIYCELCYELSPADDLAKFLASLNVRLTKSDQLLFDHIPSSFKDLHNCTSAIKLIPLKLSSGNDLTLNFTVRKDKKRFNLTFRHEKIVIHFQLSIEKTSVIHETSRILQLDQRYTHNDWTKTLSDLHKELTKPKEIVVDTKNIDEVHYNPYQ